MTQKRYTQDDLDYTDYLTDKNYETFDNIFNDDLGKVRQFGKSDPTNQRLMKCRQCLIEVLPILLCSNKYPPFECKTIAKDFIRLNKDIDELYDLIRGCQDRLTHAKTTMDTLGRKQEALRHLIKAASLLGIQTEEEIQKTIDTWAKHHEIEAQFNFYL